MKINPPAKLVRAINPLQFLWQALMNFMRHDGMMMAGHLSFLTLLAFFPFMIFLVSIAGFFGQTDAGTQALDFMFENMPPDVVNVLHKPVEKLITTTSGEIMTFSILGAIWVSSNAIEAGRTVISRAYMVSKRAAYLRRRAESLGLVILAASSILIGMSILVLGPVVWLTVTKFIPLDADWSTLWQWLRIGLSTSLVLGAVCLIYYTLRPRHQGRRPPILPGAIATILVWFTVGSTFSMYLKHFGNYDVTYGSLAGAIIALVFFYFISAGFIFGAEVNAALFAHRYPKNTEINDENQKTNTHQSD